jgi:glycerate kinase
MSRILVAPTAYKGTLSPSQVCEAIASVARSYNHDVVELPLADGGDGTIESLHLACGGDLHDLAVPGPIGDVVEALWLSLDDLAVVELASSSGIHYLTNDNLSPLAANTEGLGLVLKHCIELGFKNIVVAIGGSASTDGGSGALRSLGAKLLDASGKEVASGGGALIDLARIDLSALEKYRGKVRIRIACDVANPLLGAHGAAFVFAKQKGADDDQVGHLESALKKFADVLENESGRKLRDAHGAGAAGGTAFGLACALDAEIISGFDFVAELTDLHNKIKECDLVISGEGKLDQQSLPDLSTKSSTTSKGTGKVIGKLIDLCRIYDKRLWLICAQVDADFGINYNWQSVGIEKLQVAAPPDRKAAVSDVQKMTHKLFAT